MPNVSWNWMSSGQWLKRPKMPIERKKINIVAGLIAYEAFQWESKNLYLVRPYGERERKSGKREDFVG